MIKKLFLSLTVFVFLLNCKKAEPIADNSNSYISENKNTNSEPLVDSAAPPGYYEEVKKAITTKYVFVVLTISENTGSSYDQYGMLQIGQPEKKFYVTDIVEEARNISEEEKAKILNQVVSNYLSTSIRANQPKVLKKQIFVYEDYMSASNKRDTYIIAK